MELMNLFACRHGEQACRHRWGGDGGVHAERSMETYTSKNALQLASGNVLCAAGSPNPALCDNVERWDGRWGRFKREGTYVYPWLTYVDVWQRPTQYCKSMILQLKKLNFLSK